MELTLVLLCGVALLTGKCQSDVVIQSCPNGQRNVSEYSNASLSCGQCSDSVDWYIDGNADRSQYIGGCSRTACIVQDESAFRVNVTITEAGDLNGTLHIIGVTRHNTGVVWCKCYRYYFFYASDYQSGYYLQGSDSCKIFIEENGQESSNIWWPGAIIGGVAAFTLTIAIIGTVIVLQLKRRKETLGKENTNLSFGHCPDNLCDQEKSLSQLYAVVNMTKSEPTIKGQAAFSGNLYTVPIAATSPDVNDECITGNKVTENTILKTDTGLDLQALKVVSESWTAVMPTATPNQTSTNTMEFSNIVTKGIGYMNVTEMPTDSGLGVNHLARWSVVPAPTEPDTEDNYATVIPLDDYDYLQFNDECTGQEGQTATYYNNECFI